MPVRRPIRFPRLTRLPLAIEITLALALKLLILSILWKAFFSAPQTKKMALPTPQVESHLLSNTAKPVPKSPLSHPQKAQDDSAR